MKDKVKCTLKKKRAVTSMPYRWRTDTLRAVVMGGMRPKPSSRGRQTHSPASYAVLQVKHGRHQNAKQPEQDTRSTNTWRSLLWTREVGCRTHSRPVVTVTLIYLLYHITSLPLHSISIAFSNNLLTSSYSSVQRSKTWYDVISTIHKTCNLSQAT